MSTTVKLGVKADTSSARKSLRDLDKEVQKMQEQANARREKYRKKKEHQAQTEEPDSSAPTSQGLNIPGLGKISSIEDILGKISPAAAAATKAVSAFGGTIGACAGAAGAFVGAGALMAKGMNECVKAGAPAAKEFEAINVALSTLSKNLGGSEDVSALATDIQLLAANGVGNLEQLTQAAKTLMVAFQGNQSVVQALLPVYDDIAAGTGMSADQMAQLTARVQATGKVETEVINMLRDRGVPIYQLLAETMGTTDEKAREMAKNGQVSAAAWNDVVTRLHENYKGLSADLSGKTMDGAQATLDKMREMAYQVAAEANNAERIADANERAAKYNTDRLDVINQTQLEKIGHTVGLVGGVIDHIWNDVLTFENLTSGFFKLIGDLNGDNERIAQGLASAAKMYETLPDLTGRTAEDIAKWLTKAKERAGQLEATMKNNTGLDEELTAQMAASLTRIRANIATAEEASNIATEREAKAAADAAAQAAYAAEKKAEADKKAAEEAKALADAEKEAANQAKKEAEARAQHAEAMRKERLALAKDAREYAQKERQEQYKEEAENAAKSGNNTALQEALDKMAANLGHDDFASASQRLADLTEKIQNNTDEVTRADLQTHETLSAFLEEARNLLQTSENNKQELQDAAEAGYNEEKSQQQDDARKKAEEDISLPPDAIKEAAEQYRQELLDSGMSLAEARELFDKWVANQMENAQDNLTTDTHYRDKEGKRILADPEMKNSLKELASQAHSGDLESRREAAEQLKETREANRLAKEQLAVLSKLNFAPTAQ